ncbi:mercury methylation corrinoid protein HgcA, partial [Dissulfurirhabdus thermomarina]
AGRPGERLRPPPAAGCAIVEPGPAGDPRQQPFYAGWVETPVGMVPRLATRLRPADHLGRFRVRWGIGRDRYRVRPGLYAAGTPGPDSPVLVTANYKLSVDALRRDLDGVDAWILVLDTHGINVWCAAGKGTFGTAELCRRVRETGLAHVVAHRTLVLPQLGAPGVAAHEVRAGCGFSVVYGPVRARDLPAFLARGMEATPEMRRVTFRAAERLALVPVEVVGLAKPSVWAILAIFVLGGIGPHGFFPAAGAWPRRLAALAAYLAGVVSGAVLTPLALPWIPGRAFSLKGALAGAAVAAAAATSPAARGLGALETTAYALMVTAVASICAMNFTGASTFTSPSGVEKEMRRAIPLQAAAILAAALLWVGSAFAAGGPPWR